MKLSVGSGTWLAVISLMAAGFERGAADERLANTELLGIEGDIASQMVEGIDRFLLRKTAESAALREPFWKRDFASGDAYTASLEPNRQRLAHRLGLRDARVEVPEMTVIATTRRSGAGPVDPGPVASWVRWKVLDQVHGEGLLLEPHAAPPLVPVDLSGAPGAAGLPRRHVIAIPDADQSPEQLAGLVEGTPRDAQFARKLVESGCTVLIPTLINRQTGEAKSADVPRGEGLSNREFLYRPAFSLGRHVIGYELQKILAGVDWFLANQAEAGVGVVGCGEGGMLALMAGALDARIGAVCVSGHFGPREQLWQEPVDRNVFGLLREFGDAELAAMIAPRALIVEAARSPEAVVPPGTGGAPGRLSTPLLAEVRAEVERARRLSDGLEPPAMLELVASGEDGADPAGSDAALDRFLKALDPAAALALQGGQAAGGFVPRSIDAARRHREQMREIIDHTQRLLTGSAEVRRQFMNGLDPSSLEKFEASAEAYRDHFYQSVIGRFDDPLLPARPRTRKAYETAKWIGYEVVLDVFPEVIAYGILLLPKDLKAGERRPVVVCQHGLEGRPQELIEGDHPAYHDFAARLADRGFITFSPQNPYIFGDRFRTLQRKANPLGKTLFSIIVPQHQQIVDWLKAQPFADPGRIAFYGLSYGGKTAMRVPPLVKDYCLSICSADFNEWVWKNASTTSSYSYVWTGEYEIFEFDLGSTFNYAEMAALIAPRPFMVERGHFDGVAPDEMVAHEFAKVRHLYSAQLGIGDRCELEWFVGPHTIHGVGTFEFLHRHLRWPKPGE
jgi:dienelactone hydrolase